MFATKLKYCTVCGMDLRTKKIEERDRVVCADCGWIVYENPLPSAAAFVQNFGREILLVKRGVEPGKGEWALPSGFIEIDETPEEACLRELKEETGLDGAIVRLLGVYSQKSVMYKNVLIIGYRIDATGVLSAGSDSLIARYFVPDDLPAIAFPSHVEMIADGIKDL